ncbi:MAG: nitroreductase family protein, partial [Bacteroidales bacterium]|nr:nitroreductase family protein [Bacteroidales bacterium]
MDLAIAIDHLTLQATDLGLATCWVCNFNPEICVQELELPEGLEPAVLIPLGYPADEPDITRHERKRKSLFELVFWEKYEEDIL